ncbi:MULTISPECIES: urease accessory protein UreD [unclassified Rhodococcus (in: high G+C Gram-positive bacteria)]|uniref:urease accessory protein UreD n=1 Tax=unclassified Rhodococcus (in: high G+C Gram-positive bacteria) TaxID=192944 RepID=UPI0027E004CC|nr:MULTISPECIES: urease accessory protein UreD [unclassified Rhodococcus (in: high G+C Gram-positive bacteria)]
MTTHGALRSTVLVVASRSRSPRIEAVGGLAVRRTGVDRVHLVGSAATPLGGDTIDVRIVVEAGARLHVCSVAASVALPGRSTDVSHASWTVDVEDGAEVIVDPEPTIVAGSADHRSSVSLHLGDRVRAAVRERIQIGRTGDIDGRWSGLFRVDGVAGPVLRHRLDLGRGAAGHDALFAPTASISTLTWPECLADSPSGDAVAGLETTMPMAGGGTLSTWLGHRLPVTRSVAALSARGDQPARLASAVSAAPSFAEGSSP